ncbi:MAG: NUDIX domain-containing protein [Bacteroidota bacterium]
MKTFTVRVYGICIYHDKVLVSDERIRGMEITKFPGGGLEFGEGTIDCIRREFVEETGQEIRAIRHFYTTDFFVESAFNPNSQVISIYYLVEFLAEPVFGVKHKKFDFLRHTDDEFVFRWIPLNDLSESDFTFVIDRKVAGMLRESA